MNEYFRPRFLKPKWADSAYPDVFKEKEAQTKAALRNIRKETASKRQARSASKEQLRQAHITRINNISEADVELRNHNARNLFDPTPYRYYREGPF